MSMNFAEAAKRHRDQAEECRAKASLMTAEPTRDVYLKMADAMPYEAMADNEDRMADNFTLAPRPKAAE